MFKMEGEEIFKTVIPRMGGFHICACLEQFSLISAAGLGGMGTIKKYLGGGDVKEGVNLHKKLFEALTRSKIEYIEGQTSKNEAVQDYFHATFDAIIEEGINVENVETVVNKEKTSLPVLKGDMSQFLVI